MQPAVFVKTLLNVCLVVIFWIFFGRVSVERFLKENVLVSSTTAASDEDKLPVPAITICRRSSNSSMGWKGEKNPNITSNKEVLRHMCGEQENVTKCIEDKTFGYGDI